MKPRDKRLWNDRMRMLLRLELAIVLPAAALIGFSIWNLSKIARDKAVEAAIHRDFSYVLKAAERKINERAKELLTAARDEFPRPEEIAAKVRPEDAAIRMGYKFELVYDPVAKSMVRKPSRSSLEAMIWNEIGKPAPKPHRAGDVSTEPHRQANGKSWTDLRVEARKEPPRPSEAAKAALDQVLERHPQFAHAFLYDHKIKLLVFRSQPRLLHDEDFRAESQRTAHMMSGWMSLDAKEMIKNLRVMVEKYGEPYFTTYAGTTNRGEKKSYEVMSFCLPQNLPKDQVALAGLIFNSDYLQHEFFPAMLDSVLAKDAEQSKHTTNQAALMVHMKKEYSPWAASADWDGGKPEVERPFEDIFSGLVLGIKFRGTTVAAIGRDFMLTNFWILGALSLLLSAGIFITYRNVSREMALAKLKSDFVANVSHELRTPLALIRLYAETLELGRLTAPEKHQEYYCIIRKESERLSALINNILDFSRIEAGRKEYDFRETNLAELVRNTLEAYRYQIEQNGFAFQENIAGDLPPVRVDREAIARSLLNLVNNALKYSAENKYLGVNLYRGNGEVKLEVVDHGIGIPHGEQDKIFEKFYRVGDPLVHNTKGSGLGLSLVRHVVQAHGGQVSVESSPGRGSKFIIALPVEPDQRGAQPA